jgi:hypothetical protein
MSLHVLAYKLKRGRHKLAVAFGEVRLVGDSATRPEIGWSAGARASASRCFPWEEREL